MPFPRLVRAALDSVGSLSLPGRLADGSSCQGARHHSPNPLLLKEVALSPSGGGSAVWLCGTCADNLAVLQHLLIEHGGALPWPVRREFGNMIRALAEQGWSEDQALATRGLHPVRSTPPQGTMQEETSR